MAADHAVGHEIRALRLFLAAEVPEGVKTALGVAIEPWRRTLPGARWIPPESWHITLKFLGPTDPQRLQWIEEAIGSVASAHAPAEVQLANLGAFPAAGRARVLWAGVEDADHRLAALAADLQVALGDAFPSEARSFHAHLTVARSDPPLVLPSGFAETSCESGLFVIDRLILYRSHLQRPHPRYEVLSVLPLGR
jgi:RNA 2',3'-cyclic 3'-phosphodiesterase